MKKNITITYEITQEEYIKIQDSLADIRYFFEHDEGYRDDAISAIEAIQDIIDSNE